MIRKQKKSFYNLVFQRTVVLTYTMPTVILTSLKNIYDEWDLNTNERKKEKKSACDLTCTLSLLAYFFKWKSK